MQNNKTPIDSSGYTKSHRKNSRVPSEKRKLSRNKGKRDLAGVSIFIPGYKIHKVDHSSDIARGGAAVLIKQEIEFSQSEPQLS
ncbi:uncharacterized protein [Drosophila virilis]|uniref:uncharacterized protein n=1 Tax=Drosophila virilis TaxID=7244 RepID=UPI0038B27311